MDKSRLPKASLVALLASAITAGIIDSWAGKGALSRGTAASLIIAGLLCMLVFVGVASRNHTQLALNALLALTAVMIGRLLLAF